MPAELLNELHLQGLIVGLCTFLIIGVFHPIVIKCEYCFGVRCWWWFLVLGIVMCGTSIMIENTVFSTLCGVTGFSSFWTIKEIFEQRERVRKGWFPANPARDKNEARTVYRSGIDWLVWCIVGFIIAVTIVATIGTYWWLALIFGVSQAAMLVVGIFGCYYAIDGDSLIVYQFFRPHAMPISKIKTIRYTTGYLATAGSSSKRVSISFVDRSVMKSSMPLEISPKDRDGFVAHLTAINPNIQVIK